MATFGDHVRRTAQERGLAAPSTADPEPLAKLDYGVERSLKQAALEAFWKEFALPGRPEPLVPAPQPRLYRSTSKRRALAGRDGLALLFLNDQGSKAGAAVSLLDREDHGAVYAFLYKELLRPRLKPLVEALNFAIVRGGAGKLAVILNVRVFDAEVMRGAKQIGEELKDSKLGIGAAFLFLDPTGSDYYLEARRPEGVLSFKRLFGPEWLEVEVDGVKLRYAPTAFSQVNEPMLPEMLRTAAAGLAPLEGRALLDLYCGYGLFSLTIGRKAAQVTGVDLDGPAIDSARGNAKHLKSPARFMAGRVTAEFLHQRVDRPSIPEVVLLDPPSQGTEAGVVESVAARKPERVVHVCCGTDEIPRELKAWTLAGYRLQRAVPLDLFAGTLNLETFLVLGR